MEELYWITRLDAALTLVKTAIGVFSAMLVFCGFFRFIELTEEETYSSFSVKKWLRISVIALICLGIIRVFIPTNKELLAIYGIGATIDYIKTDSVATNLPSKAIKAIDLWLDEKNNE